VILEAHDVSKTFRSRRGTREVPAVNGVSVLARPGEFIAVVGESGSGKSTLARLLLGLTAPSAGAVALDGADIAAMGRAQRRRFRRTVQAVLQDPAGSLNPRKKVGTALAEVIRLHQIARSRSDVRSKCVEVLDRVGLAPAQDFLASFPHELSGGERQRVLIARAIALDPRIIIADEAVSALDASVKAGVLKLMNGLKDELGVGYVFITHDLPVVRKVADHVHVMKDGTIVESGPTHALLTRPQHPYTAALVDAAPPGIGSHLRPPTDPARP
jgi:ABC-type glutathione transport system ATPase component